jgi:hypothetical protein
MLHLLPLRSLGRFALTVTVLGVVAVIVIGSTVPGTGLTQAMTILRWVLSVEAVAALVIFYCWHRIPGLTKRWLFPHIDGSWDGALHFKRKVPKSEDQVSRVIEDSRLASLYIHQSLNKLRLILETEESTSETLVVHAERDPDFSRFRLFYIFENRSRDGLPNTARSYRGTAVMEVAPGRPTILNGTYFTDQGSEGTFRFERCKPAYRGWRSWWYGLVGEKGAAKPIAGSPRDARALELD